MKARAGGATLLESPEPGARTFGRLGAGTAVTVLATASDLTKVALGEGRFGFVKTSELEQGGTPGNVVAFEETMRRFPPSVDVDPIALSVKDDKVLIKGAANDADRILDGYVFVGNRKVFYRSNRNGADPKRMTFEASIPLRPGVNAITVVARENPDTVGRKTLIVRRDGPNGEILQTPKTEEDLESASAADD
jgi:carboxyl-terminal processing protease